MKQFNINPYTQMEDEMYISDELRELLYERWLSRYEKSVLEENKRREEENKRREEESERRRKLREELWNTFFILNICFLHDRECCCECRVHATATCPSALEEDLPNNF